MTSPRQTTHSGSHSSGNNWQHTKSRHERGYGHAWDKLRKIAMQRDCWLCQPCLKAGKATPATECDHINPKANGGTDDIENLQAICSACHADKTQQEAAAAQGRTTKPRLQFDAQGFPIW